MDEVAGVVGANPEDMAKWWPQVVAEFDGQAPYVRDIKVPSADGMIVVVLLFETERAPFVVRNAVHGQKGGGPVEREVPWREGTSVRSATRSDLLRLLIPASELPILDVYSTEAEFYAHENSVPYLRVILTTYAVISIGTAVVLPNHQARGTFHFIEHDVKGTLETHLVAKSDNSRPGLTPSTVSRIHTVHQGDQQVLLEGPGFFQFIGKYRLTDLDDAGGMSGPLAVTFSARPAGSDLSRTVQAKLLPRLSTNEK
ncbi:MAG: hypothetical protein LC775_06445, partial [Acidobacteria bacterium]|nr:hypothetical protein [Acidobacteriota bacterium]